MINLLLLEPPCDQCNGACCQQANHKYAVELLDEEKHLYPERISVPSDFPSESTIEVIPYVNGKCIHLGLNNRCQIYDHRPFRCRDFNCLVGYQSKVNKQHSFFLEDNPQVVELIQRNYKL